MEIYERGNYVCGAGLLPDKRLDEECSLDPLIFDKRPEREELVKNGNIIRILDQRKEMGKIVGKYQILQVLSYAFTQE